MPNFNPRILTSCRDFGGAVFKAHAGMAAHDKIGLTGRSQRAVCRPLRPHTALTASRSRSTRLSCTQCIESSIDDCGLRGLGILIGDGKLNYREKKVLEAYYAYGFNKWTTLTLRGPVSIYSARFHAEF